MAVGRRGKKKRESLLHSDLELGVLIRQFLLLHQLIVRELICDECADMRLCSCGKVAMGEGQQGEEYFHHCRFYFISVRNQVLCLSCDLSKEGFRQSFLTSKPL